jgi:hypothetical protein
MHTSLTLADRSAPEPEPVVPPGGKAAPGGGALGSFMYLKNSRFDPAAPSPDNPVYWVGRVAEIMRGGRVRLHWHRETALGSGAYVSTNNYFPERAALLQSFRAVVWEPAAKAPSAHWLSRCSRTRRAGRSFFSACTRACSRARCRY